MSTDYFRVEAFGSRGRYAKHQDFSRDLFLQHELSLSAGFACILTTAGRKKVVNKEVFVEALPYQQQGKKFFTVHDALN